MSSQNTDDKKPKTTWERMNKDSTAELQDDEVDPMDPKVK